jgi:hypothetical protein
MPEKKKRKYTFRKDQPIPYESGSPMHKMAKAQKEAFEVFRPKKKKR